MAIKDTDPRLMCRVMLKYGSCVGYGALVEIVTGADLAVVDAAVLAIHGPPVPDGMVVVRYVDGVVHDSSRYKRAVDKLGFWPFGHDVESLRPMTRAAAWYLANLRWMTG